MYRLDPGSLLYYTGERSSSIWGGGGGGGGEINLFCERGKRVPPALLPHQSQVTKQGNKIAAIPYRVR